MFDTILSYRAPLLEKSLKLVLRKLSTVTKNSTPHERSPNRSPLAPATYRWSIDAQNYVLWWFMELSATKNTAESSWYRNYWQVSDQTWFFEFFQICRPATEFAAGIDTGYRSWIVKLGFEATPSRIHWTQAAHSDVHWGEIDFFDQKRLKTLILQVSPTSPHLK